MRIRIAVSLAALAVALATTAEAGTFLWFQGADIVSVQPPRVRVRFGVIPTHLFGHSLCALELRSGVTANAPLRAILGGEGPPGTTCTIDSTGVARFVMTPCRPPGGSGGSIDSLAVIVDGAPAHLIAEYVSSQGIPVAGDTMDVPNDLSPTPAKTATWGRLKILYR